MIRLRLFATVALILTASSWSGAADYAKKASWAETMTAMRASYLQAPEAQAAAARDSLFKPFDSGRIDGKGPAKKVVVDIAGLREMRLVSICEKGPANCNIWGEPKLIAKDGTVTKLTELKPTKVSVGWGQLLVDKNWQNHPLIVGDRQFEFGFWVHANSELTFALDGKYERFEAFVGEDKDRAGGLVRFKVLSAAAPLPTFWSALASDFSLQAGWLRGDAGADGVAAWFGKREMGALEQEIIGRPLRGAASDSPLRAEFKTLVEAKVGAGDARWLDLYVRACRYRDCAAMLKTLASAEARAAFEKELAALVAAKAPAEDASWDQLRARVVRAGELDHQFATLQHDIRQRAVLSKATGERVWNGTTYVPKERSTAEEIASQVFNRTALVLETDRDPADIVLRRTQALLADLKKLAGSEFATYDAPLAELERAVADTPVTDADARRASHHDICRLRRQIAFANPLLDFQDLVFIKRHRAFYHHMCDQYYGIVQNPGGGLYMLEDAFGPNPQVRDILANSVCETGRLKGQRLSGGSVKRPSLRYDGQRTFSGEDAEGGSFLSPALSPDARQVAFAYVERKGGKEQIFHEDPTRGHWDMQRCYHIFKVNVDGTNLGGFARAS